MRMRTLRWLENKHDVNNGHNGQVVYIPHLEGGDDGEDEDGDDDLVGVCREVADELYSTSCLEQPLSLVVPTTHVSNSEQVASADTGDELDASRTRRMCVGGEERRDATNAMIAINASSHVRGTSRLPCLHTGDDAPRPPQACSPSTTSP